MLQTLWISCLLLLLKISFAKCSSTDSFYFTQSPQNQDVEEGQPLRLECAVKPNDDIHYSWLHNGSMIKPELESGRRFLEGVSNLQILHADRDSDPGRYQCQALNKTSKFVSASREANINVYWMEPEVTIRLVKPARIEDIQIGGEVEFACRVQANPPATMNNILWFHNGNSRLPNMQSLKNGNLHIASFGMQHTGSFHCRVIHPAGKMDSRPPFLVQMSADESPVVDTRQTSESFLVYALADRPVKLICPHPPMSADDMPGDMSAITVWGFMKRLGEQQQPISSLHAVRLLEEDTVLAIDRFKAVHANFYTCEVSFPTSSDRYFYVFQVYQAELYPPKPFNFSPRPRQNQPLAVRLRDTLILRYYADLTPSASYTAENISNPPPQIEWFRVKPNAQEPIRIPSTASLNEAANTRVFVLGGRHLVIRDSNELDSGAYELVLTNTAGRVSVNFRIMVTFPPDLEPQSETLNSQTLDEGQELMLGCRIRRRANPGSRIYWEKDGRALVNYGNDIILDGDGERLQFPRVTVDHQGLYQCFVITDGYPKKFPGQPQNLVVRGRLEFLRKIKEHFLEVNVQGQLTCKVRGYGDLAIDWFRKSDQGKLEPIQLPNQVEKGVLIFQYVQKQDAGDYVCIARSSYRDSQINMTVNVIVGEKPQILDISTNQTISEGNRLILNCKASGDPTPQISWFVKKPNIKFPAVYASHMLGRTAFDMSNQNQGSGDDGSFIEQPVDARIQVLTNGSLVISQALLIDNAEYICIAGNKHAIKTQQGVHVHVLTSDEYTKLKLGDESLSSSMVKSIVIVVNCAVAYLGLIFGLTVYCSIRHLKNRRNRTQNGKAPETGHLIGPNGMSQDNNCALLLNDDTMNAGSRTATTGSPNDSSGINAATAKQPAYRNYSDNQSKTYYHDGPSNNNFSMSDGSRPMIPLGYSSSNDMSMVSHQMQQQNATSGNQGLGIATYPNQCGGASMTSTTTGESNQLVTAPPPTPLDSRSHFSGLSSSGNSASAYSRSLISGASNSTGAQFPSNSPQAGLYTNHGGHPQYSQPNPGDMMTYTHCE